MIPILIFDAKQKYLNVMKIKILDAKKIVEWPPVKLKSCNVNGPSLSVYSDLMWFWDLRYSEVG